MFCYHLLFIVEMFAPDKTPIGLPKLDSVYYTVRIQRQWFHLGFRGGS
ncbi:hypothetical protein HMPREF0578_1158 [Mobiluncus mulieris 28-1]|nr:hypothetical protein HMPREF0578_1158 [Mobiluncus mulieris 28-1]